MDYELGSSKNCTMRKKTIITAIAIAGLLALFWLSDGGVLLMELDMLFAHNKDVTPKEDYWGEYKFGQRYELLIDVFLEQANDWSSRLVLTPPGQLPQGAGLYSAPNSITEYQQKHGDWPEVVGIVGTGTQLKCKTLRKHGTLMWGSSITIFAEILDGPYTGQIVDIDDLSTMIDKEYRGIILYKPDPRILREVAEQTVDGNNM
jgi:hypothetical protein